MKKLFIGLFLIVCFIAGCSRSTAPPKDSAGVTPTGQTLTIRLTGNTTSAGLGYTRTGFPPVNKEVVSLPYEETFNVKSGDQFEFASSIAKAAQTNTRADLKIELFLDGNPVAEGKEGNPVPYVTSVTYTIP